MEESTTTEIHYYSAASRAIASFSLISPLTPIYQFRTYNAINRMHSFLSNLPVMNESDLLKTIDNCPIDQLLVKMAIDEATDMIYSFESCFETTYGEERRLVETMLKQSWRAEEKNIPRDPHKTPFLMPVFAPVSPHLTQQWNIKKNGSQNPVQYVTSNGTGCLIV